MAADIGIPDRLLPAIRLAVFWISLPFIGLLLAGEKISEGKYYEAGAWLIAAILSIAVAVYWDQIIAWLWPRYNHQQEFQYLSDRDPPLGSAIQSMARRSAWGRWFAAQQLVNSGAPIDEQFLMQIAASNVTGKIVDGEIEVRGRRPGQMSYEIIPRTDWNSSALSFVSDPKSIWKLVIFPRGGAEIAPDGSIARASNAAAAARTSQITQFDSLIVDAHQFERVWPKSDVLADRTRRLFLRTARKRKLDKAEIQRLSDPRRNVWPVLLIVAAVIPLFAYMAGPGIYRRAIELTTPPNRFTQQQVDEKIAEATASLRMQLSGAIKGQSDLQRENDRLRQVLSERPAALPTVSVPRLGPITTFRMINSFNVPDDIGGRNGEIPADKEWAILVTGSNRSTRLREIVGLILGNALKNATFLPAPDQSNLDAPRLPDAEKMPGGLTLHGNNLLNKRIIETFGPCVNIHTTATTIPALADWYKLNEKQTLVWIETGDVGETWKNYAQCSD